jgi:predicted nucleotidyltransferase
MNNEYLEPYKPVLVSIQELFDNFPHQGVVIGGIAVTILGEQRFTADVDILVLISNDQLNDFIEASRSAGFASRVTDLPAFAKQNRVIPLIHSESGLKADFVMGFLPFEREVVARAKKVVIHNVEITLPTVEDLIIMKAIAHRPKDLSDITGLVKNHDALDMERMKYWVTQFGEAIEQPNLWDSIQQYLKS